MLRSLVVGIIRWVIYGVLYTISPTGGSMTADSKGPKRPRDPNQLAKFIVDVASGQIEGRDPTPEEQGKDPAAVQTSPLRG